MGTTRRLTSRQRVFVEEYLRCWNASEAARKAGYSARSLRFIASENLTKPNIREAIRRRLSEVAMSADEALARLAEQGRSDMAQFVTIDHETGETKVDLRAAQEAGLTHLIKSIRQTRYGTSIELYDAQAALIQIGRAHGLFTDHLDLVSSGQPLAIREVIVELPAHENGDTVED